MRIRHAVLLGLPSCWLYPKLAPAGWGLRSLWRRSTGALPLAVGRRFSAGRRASLRRSEELRLKAYYINTELDEARRVGMEATCLLLDLNCQRVVPPLLSDHVVRRCVEETPLRAFECSLVHAHRGILRHIRAAGEVALVLEDDARLNVQVEAEKAKEMLREAAIKGFVMAGWRPEGVRVA